MARWHFDFETRATVDIKLGVHKYAEHPATQVLCMAYARDHEPPKIWRPLLGEPFPQELIDAVLAGDIFVAHNVAFDREIWNVVVRRKWPHVPALPLEQTDCTMVRAQALRLPGGLEQLCKALKLPVEKDTEGAKVMMRLCKPQKRGGHLVWIDDPELYDRLYAYCLQDIVAERPVDDLLPPLPDYEREVWLLSERINARGIAVDVASVQRLAEIVEAEGKHLSYTVSKLTGGAATATQRGELLKWLRARGLEIEDMQKSTLRDVRESADTLAEIKHVLDVQSEATKTSTAKLKKMLKRAGADGRMRGEYRYHGAGTGRWSSHGVQVHNFARPDAAFGVDESRWLYAFSKMPNGRDFIRREFGSVMFAASNALRPLMQAGPGNELVCADYSNIEGRVLAWLAGEDWKLQAFRDFDAGNGVDLYKLAFAAAFGIAAADVDKEQRQIGKVMELALGYQGGVGAFLSMAAGYGADIAAMADVVQRRTPRDEWDRYAAKYDEKGTNKFDLPLEHWTAIKALVGKWREANGKIRRYWYELEDAAIAAVAKPGEITGSGDVFFRVENIRADGGNDPRPFLRMRLPSGRKLSYAYPELRSVDTPWDTTKRAVLVQGAEKGGFMPMYLYGGLLAENATQAVARDLLAEAMLRLERAGYPIMLHTHDECAAEVPRGYGSDSEFAALMCELPKWANGIPVTVSTPWRGVRYRKD